MLDRLAGDDPPRLLVVDPRRTPVAERASVHLAPRPGTNLALMNALLHELIDRDLDRSWLRRARTPSGSMNWPSGSGTAPPEWAADDL